MGYHQNYQKTALRPLERIVPEDLPWYGKKTLLEHIMRYNFAKLFVKGKIVAELGCGSGYGTYQLAQAGSQKIYAIDNSRQAISFAKKHYHHPLIEYRVADAKNTKLPQESMDLVIAFETIEHIKNSQQFLNEVIHILKKGGIFILSTPNKETSLANNPYHFKEYSLADLKNALHLFPLRKFYGQRKVNKIVLTIYKKLARLINFSLMKQILTFRPWENPAIYPLKNFSDTSYLYFLAICQKK